MGWQNLEGIGLKDKIESAAPYGGRVKQIGGDIVNCGIGKTFARSANGGFRDVEGGGMEAPGGELLGIVAQAAADGESRFSCGLLRMCAPKIKQEGIGSQTGPRNRALPCLAFLVKRLEPSGGVALTMEFGCKFPGSRAIFHLGRF